MIYSSLESEEEMENDITLSSSHKKTLFSLRDEKCLLRNLFAQNQVDFSGKKNSNLAKCKFHEWEIFEE